MRRRPSGSPIEDESCDIPTTDVSSAQVADPVAHEDGHALRVNVSVESGEVTHRDSSAHSTPRTRTSASWKRPMAEDIATEPAPSAEMLPGVRAGRKNGSNSTRLLRSRSRSPWLFSLLTSLTTAVSFLLLFAIIRSAMTRQRDPQGCVMSRMTPTYIKLSEFDTEHTRFATKYSLYLYREEGVDEYASENIGLRGAPVLFLPGNAGSYKQVRSLSSEASRYYHHHLRPSHNGVQPGSSSLDFFTIDFNEDLAAFHGQTLVDQAEYVNEAVAYIISLYNDPRRSQRDQSLPDPSSVILIGHSMGGLVARAVLVTPNYQMDSVNTIITMSTPHARPPVSFDADIVSTYDRVNDFWRQSYTQNWTNNNPLRHTTLLSIAGGGLDTTVPSDYASLSSLVPSSNGFTVFTSSIPDVWTGMDHLAITWADQIRKVIVKSLLEIIDVRRPSQTKPRADRMRIFRKWYLTGLEVDAPRFMLGNDPSVLLTLGTGSRTEISRTSNLTIHRLGVPGHATAKLLPILDSTHGPDRLLTLLSDRQADKDGIFDDIDVLFCSAFPLSASQSSSILPEHIDLSDGNPGATRLACKRPSGDTIHLPASAKTSKNAFEQVPPFTYLQYRIQDLVGHQFLAIVDRGAEPSDGWVTAEVVNAAESTISTNIGLRRLMLSGLHLTLPANRPMMMDLKIPTVQSSLLAFDLRLRHQGCAHDEELLTPLVRQHIEAPYESKYFVNFKQGDVNLHGAAPFMPPSLPGTDVFNGVSFQIWSDTSCDTTLEFSLKVDFFGSMGKLVIRYRTVFAAFPILVVAMVLRKQFRVYDNTGVFITFTESLDESLQLAIPVLLLSMTFFATAISAASTSPVSTGGVSNITSSTIDYTQNDLLLGSRDPFFWFLVPLAGLISVGACVAVNYLVLSIVYLFSYLYFLCTPRPGYVKLEESKRSGPGMFVTSTPRRRVINTAILLVLVSTVVPYQFAFLVACIVQLATCVRALRQVRESPATHHNFFNYAHSILILMLWILPIHLPTLVVWAHNLAVHWLTPFSSHHNVLSIMPILLLVETLTGGSTVPKMTAPTKWVTNILFFVFSAYAAVYGVTFAYRLHHLANIVALWLVCLHFSPTPGFPLGALSRLFEKEADPGTTDIKKMP